MIVTLSNAPDILGRKIVILNPHVLFARSTYYGNPIDEVEGLKVGNVPPTGAVSFVELLFFNSRSYISRS